MKYRPFIVIFICAILAISCGGNFSQSDVNGTIEPEDLPINLQVDNDNTNEQTHQRTNAPDYSGKVVIKFKDGTDVRLSSFDRLRTNGDDGPFMSLAGADVREINEILRSAQNDRVGGITRVMTASEEEVSRWQEYWRKRGVTLHDWNLYYYLEVPEYEDARELVDILSCHPCENRDPECANEIPACAGMTELIEYSEILPIFYLTSVTTPDMSDEQGYLKSADEGGLGIEDAWAKLDEQFPDIKLRGQNSMVVDQEFDWNFDHEILPIDETGEYMFDPAMVLWIKENPKWPGKDIPENIHHGTAVVGIIAGQGNGGDGGISGIASKTAMRVASISGTGGMGNLKLYGDGDGYTIGLIFTIEVQRKGATTTSSGCTIGDGIASPTITGCVPMEASKYLFDVIQTTTSVGAIIVEGAGNGSVDLDTDAAEPKDVEFSNFSDPANDSGAIMVGASMGASRQKAAWSNCGSRVDVFGWGAGVVTSGYGDKYCEEGANGKACTDPDNPTKYTGQFGGTSAATAQIAGIAALVQSYMRQLVFEAGYNGKVVYLDSKQMRTILKNSGQPAVYNQTPNDPNPNCNIGVQPDMAKAIEETNKFLNAGNILKVVPLNGNSDPNGGPGGGVVAGIRYDMDGDGRAELISFSRDHKWYIDLSSTKQGAVSGEQLANCEQSADGYCAWDVILSLPQAGEGSPEPNAMLFPVVHDYNSDGWADLALYDSINGKWYIKYSGQWLVASGQEEQMKWDKIIDYSADPAWKKYSRPVPGDYDGDNWLDTALQTPDGHWLIDYGGFDGVKLSPPPQPSPLEGEGKGGGAIAVQFLDHFGSFDKDVKYLTDEQLAQAPGWAWLPIHGGGISKTNMAFRGPDGVADAGKAFYAFETGPGIIESNYHGNDYVPIAMKRYSSDDISEKNPDGHWQIQYGGWDGFVEPEPAGVYGDINCRPIPADYDGDKKDDLAVQCGTTWKIAYSSQPGSLSEIDLDQALDPLPAFAYPGGIKYQDTIDLYNYYKEDLGGFKNSTIFDAPPPIGPYFAQCVKYWAPNASYCWNK